VLAAALHEEVTPDAERLDAAGGRRAWVIHLSEVRSFYLDALCIDSCVGSISSRSPSDAAGLALWARSREIPARAEFVDWIVPSGRSIKGSPRMPAQARLAHRAAVTRRVG
jgi:hypothetical protein